MSADKSFLEQIPADFNGILSLSQGDDPVFEHCAGYTDLPNRLPVCPDTRFPTASAGKGFVAAAILRLIQQGRLRFEDTLGGLADFPLGRMDPAVTVWQLLSHTSGIPDYFDESVMTEYDELWRDFPNYKIRQSADLLPLFIHKPMMYPRGERFQYNNSGYVVLGLILEAVKGKPFDQVLAEEVFAPCEMTDTGYFELDCLPARCASAYVSAKDGCFRTNIYSVDAKGTGAGGAFTTVRDMRRFWLGLCGGSLLSEDLLQKMFTPSSKEGCYGLGVWLDCRSGAAPLVYLEGCDPGVSFYSVFDPSSHKLMTLMSNLWQNVWQIGRALAPLFF